MSVIGSTLVLPCEGGAEGARAAVLADEEGARGAALAGGGSRFCIPRKKPPAPPAARPRIAPMSELFLSRTRVIRRPRCELRPSVRGASLGLPRAGRWRARAGGPT